MTERVQGPASYFPSIEKKYGRPINDWLGLIRGCELTKHKALVDWLKAGHGHATALVGYALAQLSTNHPSQATTRPLPTGRRSNAPGLPGSRQAVLAGSAGRSTGRRPAHLARRPGRRFRSRPQARFPGSA